MTARWRKARRTLFHNDGAASTDEAPPGNLLLRWRPNLHCRMKNRRFPNIRDPEGRRRREGTAISLAGARITL
jgi:hypothetical protein